MRLARVRIENFKSIDNLEIEIPRTDSNRPGSADFVTLIGENNAGKSSVIEALLFALPETEKIRPSADHFPARDVTNGPIEVDLTFDSLTDADLEKQAIRRHVYEEQYRIKKVWDAANTKPEVFAWEPGYSIPELDSGPVKLAELQGRSTDWHDVVAGFQASLGGKTPSESRKLSTANLGKLKEFVIEHHASLAQPTSPGWNKNPGGISANVDSVLPLAIFVPGIKEVSSETTTSKEASATQNLVAALFGHALARNPAVMALRDAAAEIEALFASGSRDPAVSLLQNTLTTKLKRLIDLSVNLTFEPPDMARDLAKSTSLSILDGGLEISPNYLGHGAQRALIVTLLELLSEQRRENAGADARPLLLLVEEPEIYLHPYMCRRIRNVLVDLSRSGTAQVICTSHSPIFLDLADRHDGIVILRKKGGHPASTQRTTDVFTGTTAAEDRERLRMLLNFDPSVCEVFFTDRVCLVEGDCEVASVWAIAERLVADGEVDRHALEAQLAKVAIVNCRGKWTIRAFQKVLKAFAVPYRVVHDVDTGAPATANAQILDLLEGKASKVLTHDPNFEEAVWGTPWSDNKPWRAAESIRTDTLNPKLVSFFEFVLGATLEDLR